MLRILNIPIGVLIVAKVVYFVGLIVEAPDVIERYLEVRFGKLGSLVPWN